MWPVSSRFLDALTGTHEAVSRCWLRSRRTSADALGIGPAPGGTPVPIIGGDVKMTRTGDVKATLEITVPGEFWPLVRPAGNELFVERGIDFGDGTQEFVPLGYYRIEDVQQDSAPDGVLRVSGSDRISQIIQNRVLYPYQVPESTSHRTLFERFVNGRPASGGAASQPGYGYGSWVSAALPIVWTGYDPDAATVVGSPVAEDSLHEVLAKVAADRDCVLRMADTGELLVELRDGPTDAVPLFAITGGERGNLVRASRRVTREGVYNVVSAYGSDPAAPTGYQLAYDMTSPVRYDSPFGVAPRYFASPLLRTDTAAQAAATTLVSKYGGLPTDLSLEIVPNPALRPNDVISVDLGDGAPAEVRIVDEVSIPLAGSAPMSVTTLPLESA